ncbi:MAG: sulfite exporter TauE/SafE family protein [Cyanobacteriota bacterium]|nr:sulfite exporter TauE/SafE family protein [Cyanobacteriota bacterium]
MDHWLPLIAAGVLGGFLNAAASSGSAITLPLLLSFGLPPAVANGTNRLPVLVGLATAFWRFQRAGAIPWRFTLTLMPAFVVSALIGARLAAMLTMENVRGLVHVALLLALAVVLLRPDRLLAEKPSADAQPISLRLQLLIAGVGLWTGLIVLDAATYLLVSLVLIGGVALQQATAIKAVLIGTATLGSVVVFLQEGDIDWAAAMPLMLGSALGGWLGATLALGPQARIWIYRLLIVAISSEVIWMLWGLSRR